MTQPKRGLMSSIRFRFARLHYALVNAYIEFYAQARFKLFWASVIGAIGFPLFFAVWTYLFPQDYENIYLRLTGTAACVLLGLQNRWPRSLRPYLPLFAYLTALFVLPYFFTFMFLMNAANPVWNLSLVGAVVYMALLYDPVNLLVSAVIGSLLAIFTYFLVTNAEALPYDYFIALPALLFVLVGILLLNFSERAITAHKRDAAAALAGQIAHEMRTPLLGIDLDARKIADSLPQLIALARRDDGTPPGAQSATPPISARRAAQLEPSVKRITEHVASANFVIDVLLMNAQGALRSQLQADQISMRSCVQTALDRVEQKSGDTIAFRVIGDEDFVFRGSEILMTHVLLNLLSNAARAVGVRFDGEVTVRLVCQGATNTLEIADNGVGIAAESIPLIFTPFYSQERERLGTGIGLSFCRDAIETMDGLISCKSTEGVGSTFSIELPAVTVAGAKARTAAGDVCSDQRRHASEPLHRDAADDRDNDDTES